MSNGKGSKARPLSVSRDAFGAEFDRIFGAQEPTPPVRNPYRSLLFGAGCGCGSRVYVDDHAGKRCFLCGMGAR